MLLKVKLIYSFRNHFVLYFLVNKLFLRIFVEQNEDLYFQIMYVLYKTGICLSFIATVAVSFFKSVGGWGKSAFKTGIS